MAIDRIQFQPGLSMPDFLKYYGAEALCEQALEAARWPEGGPGREEDKVPFIAAVSLVRGGTLAARTPDVANGLDLS